MGQRERKAWNVTLFVCYLVLALLIGVHSARAQTTLADPGRFPVDLFDYAPVAYDILSHTRLIERECDDLDTLIYADPEDLADGLTRLTCATVHEPFIDWLDRYDPWVRSYQGLDWLSPWKVLPYGDEGQGYIGGFIGTDEYYYFITIDQSFNTPDVGRVVIQTIWPNGSIEGE